MNIQEKPQTSQQLYNSEAFHKDLIVLINRHSMENQNDTPDWILADYIMNCLIAFTATTNKRDKWWGHKLWNNKQMEENT